MKKALRNFGLAIAAILMAVSFAACSDDDDKDKDSSGGSIVGTWKYTERDEYGYFSQSMTFDSDGGFYMSYTEKLDDESYSGYFSGTYKTKGKLLIIQITESSYEEDEGEEWEVGYEVKNNKLYFYESDDYGNIDYSEPEAVYTRQ